MDDDWGYPHFRKRPNIIDIVTDLDHSQNSLFVNSTSKLIQVFLFLIFGFALNQPGARLMVGQSVQHCELILANGR